jgi:hypothetical protein
MAQLIFMFVVPLQRPVRGGRDDKMHGVLFERGCGACVAVNQLMRGLSSLHKAVNALNRSTITGYAGNAVIGFARGNEFGKQGLLVVTWL